MSKRTEGETASRRNFLKLAVTAAPAAAAAVVVQGQGAQAATAKDESGSGMRETAHTRAYYDSARF